MEYSAFRIDGEGCIALALRKTEVNKIPKDRLEAVIQPMIKALEKRKTTV